MAGSAIITGASRGLGHALATALIDRGWNVTHLSRSHVPDIPWEPCDVSDPQAVARAWRAIKATCGAPDVLINNAGVVVPGTILETAPADWRRQIEVNLNGVAWNTQQFVRHAKRKGVKILNIASTAGLGPRPGRSAYAASKAAVISFSLSMGEELRSYGIEVYTIALGPCNTQLRRALMPDEDPESILQPADAAAVIVDLIENGTCLDNQVLTIKRTGGQGT
jgi:NAD(P)-dependent dehydrogenase (short-subunit alcohol dehydrogenase family)